MDEKNKWHLFNDTNFSPRLNVMDQNQAFSPRRDRATDLPWIRPNI